MIALKENIEAAIEAREKEAQEMHRRLSQVAKEFGEAMSGKGDILSL
jgi:hypothetical protein